MKLAELIATLEAAHPRLVVPHGFTNPHSYRGYYEQLAFEPARDVPITVMYNAARSALGVTYEGYKGGDYTMTEDTDCWLATHGSVGEELGPTLLRLMLEAGTVEKLTATEELRAAIALLRGEPAPEPHPMRLPPKMPDPYTGPIIAVLDAHLTDHNTYSCAWIADDCPYLSLARAIRGLS